MMEIIGSQVGNKIAVDNSYSGHSISLSPNGSRLVVGIPFKLTINTIVIIDSYTYSYRRWSGKSF